MENPEQYWTEKRPRISKVYRGRAAQAPGFLGIKKAVPVDCDVRAFVRADDLIVRRALSDAFRRPFSEIPGKFSDSDVLFTVQQWVIDNIEYTGDDTWGSPEYWLYPEEALAVRQGDCEDFSFVIASMLLNAGIPSWKVRVTCGLVSVDGSPAAGETGGHAYVTYCRGDDWVPIDWCYCPEVLSDVNHRTPVNKRLEYKDVWFSFNNQYCWDESRAVAFGGRVREA